MKKKKQSGKRRRWCTSKLPWRIISSLVPRYIFLLCEKNWIHFRFSGNRKDILKRGVQDPSDRVQRQRLWSRAGGPHESKHLTLCKYKTVKSNSQFLGPSSFRDVFGFVWKMRAFGFGFKMVFFTKCRAITKTDVLRNTPAWLQGSTSNACEVRLKSLQVQFVVFWMGRSCFLSIRSLYGFT